MVRIFTVSDIHADYPENFEWCNKLSHADYINDTLIVAGYGSVVMCVISRDISARLDLIKDVLVVLKSKFLHVFFVPGNHDLWIGRKVCGVLHKLLY